MKALFMLMLVAVGAGAVLPLQAGLNAKMSRVVGDPVFGSLISFLVGSTALLCYAFVSKVDFSQINAARHEHWSVWIPGLLGAFFVSSVILLVPKLGVALTFGLIVTGQLGLSLLLDHYGMLGLPVHHINWQRLLGVLLIIGGVVLIRKF
jgi:transporter family-2 protein